MQDKPVQDNRIQVVKPSLPPLEEYVRELEDIWQSAWLTNAGPKHQKLESELRRYMGVDNIELFCNGHMALEAAMSAFNLKGEVITTPFTFVSTTGAIVRSGCTPVFCDIEPEMYTLDPDKIEALITKDTCAILPVHVYGNICDRQAIEAVAAKHGIPVIYDAAHAFGMAVGGCPVGTFGDASMFSFHATKMFNTIEGGALCFKDAAPAEHLKAWREFGFADKSDAAIVGTNAKMNDFQAAMGLCNLRHIEEETRKRKTLTLRYREQFADVPGVIICPALKDVTYNYTYFPVQIDPHKFGATRDDVAAALERNGIFARKYFAPLTSAFSAYKDRGYSGTTPIAERVSQRILTLPLYADLETEQVDRICQVIKELRV